MVQLPLPDHINKENVIEAINPDKDVDGFTTTQAGMLQLGMINKRRLLPCTAKGIVTLLELSTDTLTGKRVTVIGRSNIVGKPVAQLLQEKHATVTICHSKSTNIEEYTQKSDIIVLATGQAQYFDARYFYNTKKDLIIIDAGINRDENGKLCGDLNKSYIEECNKDPRKNNWKYTPVPGGVGPMTIAMLISNIYIAYENQFDYIWNYCKNRQISEAGLNNIKD